MPDKSSTHVSALCMLNHHDEITLCDTVEAQVS